MNFINRYSNLSTGFNRRPKSTPKIVDDSNASFLRDLNLQQQNSQKIIISKRRKQQHTTEITRNKPMSLVPNRNNWIFSDIFSAPKKNSDKETIGRRRAILNDQLKKFMAREMIVKSTTTAPTAANPYLEVTKEYRKNEPKSGCENFQFKENATINDYVSQKIWPVEESVFEVTQQGENLTSLSSRELNALRNARLQMDELENELETAKYENETLRQKLSSLEQQTVKLYTAKRNLNEKLKQVVIDYEKQIDKLKNDLDFESQANRKTYLECATLRKELSEKDKEIASLTQKLYDGRKSSEIQISKLKDDIRELENRCQTAENNYAQLQNSSNLVPDVESEIVDKIEQLEEEIAENIASKTNALKSCLTKDCRKSGIVKKKRLLFKY